MNEEVYTVALKSALTEIKNICPDIRRSLILMNNGTLITADDQSLDPNMENAVSSLKDLAEKASSVGGLEGLLIDGENGKVHASRINGMYFITALSKQSDLTYLRTVTGVILPTIIKVLDSLSPEAVSPTPLKPAQRLPYVPYKPSISEPIEEEKVEEQVEEVESPTPLEEATKTSEVEEIQETPETENEAELELESPKKVTNLPSQQLIVDKFGGLMVRSDTIQIDYEVLQRWGSLLDVKDIREVDIETFKGKTSRCKAKVISDPKLEGRGLIRIPEKMCDTLEVKRGELVRVKPVIEESD
jgi:predicted regulator of Ras-like GTPase activity (Roadblock/LC7/MglB family)